jgi:hypothetical protein
MEQRSSVPPIPALPVTEAHTLEAIERKLSSALENCMDRYGAIANELKTDTYMRSYVVKIFSLYLSAYSKHSTVLKHWIPELKLNSIQWVMGCLSDFSGVTEKEAKRYEKLLIATLNEYVESAFGNSANPLLAALAEPQPAKLARAYAASGIDVASGPPLLKMAAASANVPAVWAPVPRKRIGRSIQSERAAQRMEAYIQEKGITQTQFSVAVNADPKTLYRFRRTFRVEKSVAKRIANAMGITLEQLIA